MLRVNDYESSSVVFLTPPSLSWVNELCDHLIKAGYRVHTIAVIDEGTPLQSADAVVLSGNLEDPNLLEKLKALPNTPLRVWITGDPIDEHYRSAVDLVLPPHPLAAHQQLQTFLRLRAENRELLQKVATLSAQVQTTEQKVETLSKDNQLLDTEFQNQRRAAAEIEILKNAIVRNVSHELKTPLLQVKSAVSLLSEGVKDPKLMDYATNATTRLETLVKNITLLGSSLEMNPGPVIVRDAVEYSRRNLRRIWQHKDEVDRIKVELDMNTPPVHADKQGLSTVLQLLMDNALKFSKEDVNIGAAHIGDHIRVWVKDYGIGIPKDQRDKIFDSFYQIDNSATRRYGGTGVGLAIVRLILEHHNSTIVVESEEGKGSTFSFMLPVVKI